MPPRRGVGLHGLNRAPRLPPMASPALAGHTLSKCAPQRSGQAGTVRDLRSKLAMGTGGPPRTRVNETMNETGGAGGLASAWRQS